MFYVFAMTFAYTLQEAFTKIFDKHYTKFARIWVFTYPHSPEWRFGPYAGEYGSIVTRILNILCSENLLMLRLVVVWNYFAYFIWDYILKLSKLGLSMDSFMLKFFQFFTADVEC